MTVATLNSSHIAEAQALLLEQFSNSTKLKALLASYITPLQTLEEEIYKFLAGRVLPTAEGTQLDNLGDLLGTTRRDLTDDLFRIRLSAQIQILKTSGTPEQLLSLVSLMFLALQLTGLAVELTEYPPASLIIELVSTVSGTEIHSEVTDDIATQINTILQTAKPAGVRLDLIYPDLVTDEDFTFDDATPDGGNGTIDTEKGFADSVTPTTGGYFVNLLS